MKKRLMFLSLAMLILSLAKAEEITSQQALQQAQRFVQERISVGHRAPDVVPQMQMKQVSGLYVFNMADHGGYVIVSNDDRALPILGFSDRGSIDPDNMPTNMRAWLQGYADQITWLKAQGTSTTKPAAAAPALRRTHSTDAIAPMLTTRWNQLEPFNDLVPDFSSERKCATGCVATAMAQVMYYHKWPQQTTEAIPAYTMKSTSISLPSLPVTTFDWNNMVDEYLGHYDPATGYFYPKEAPTEAQRTAVATLMKYCGYAVKMDYGRESGAYSTDIAPALTKYFNYNAETTQIVYRRYYSANRWADIIYHELANGRPVIYGGQTSGQEGHQFVCDGYRYEGGTDFFHINWGWGGVSDNYFVLSALDPDEQGSGGSASGEGYRYQQDATIGVQKPTEHGTTADLTHTEFELYVNSITLIDNSARCWEPTGVRVNITNNSTEDFVNDIYLCMSHWITWEYEKKEFFHAPCSLRAGETGDIVIPFIPNVETTFTLTVMSDNVTQLEGASSTKIKVTKGDYDVNQFVPFYGEDCNEGDLASQVIIPASYLTDMAHSTLNSVTFFASTLSPITWGRAEFDVYLQEVEKTVFTANNYDEWGNMKKVYSGRLSVGGDGKMVINFSDPFEYEGGNLMIGIRQTQVGSGSKDVYWLGTYLFDPMLYVTVCKTYTIVRDAFLPKTTFDYTPSSNATIKPINVAATVSATTASVSWSNKSSYATGYNVRYRTSAVESTIFEDDFEDGLGQWTVYTKGEAPSAYGWLTKDPSTSSILGNAHSGNYVASALSWSNSAYNADNWLVTPKVVFGKELRFWVRTNSSYPDNYEVMLSTSGNNVDDFTVTLQAMAPATGEWIEKTIDLSDYAGQQGYIAIHHKDYDKDCLFIDDFGIYGNAVEAGEWQTVSATQTSTILAGLSPQTAYEVQVQAVYPGGMSDWTDIVTFMTPGSGTIVVNANSDGEGNYWTTYYNSQNSVTADANATVYTVKMSADKSQATLTEVTDRIIPVSNAVVIKSTIGTVTMTVTDNASGTLADNDLQGSATDIATPANTYMLVKGNSGVGFYHWTGSVIPAGRGYLTLSGDASVREVIPFGDGKTTEISTISKYLSTSAYVYTLDGRRVANDKLPKGVYIVNGKKLIIK